MNVTFSGPNGAKPVSYLIRVLGSALPTEGIALAAMQRQRSRILNRTDRGVDAFGQSFRPYSKSYAKQKAVYRNPGVVDLRGRNAPHMLQAMVATAGSLQASGDEQFDSDAPVSSCSLVFLDSFAALKARAHNEGTRRLPQRPFFSADNDLPDIKSDFDGMIRARVEQAL